MYQRRPGFTFVELIVATSIVAILATIGFLAYTNQIGSSRDSRRISEITAINDSLQVLSTKGAKFPLPTNSVQVTTANAIQTAGSVSLVGYQGEFGSDLLKQIGFQNGGTDPKDKIPYIYYTNKTRRYSQVMAYLEDGSNLVGFQDLFIPRANAGLSDYSLRFPKVVGKPLGIVIENATKRSIHDVSTIQTAGYFNIVTTGANYTVLLSDKEKVTGASSNLGTTLWNKSCKRIRDIGAGNGDGRYKVNPTGVAELEVYCDMTTDGGGWTLVLIGTDTDIEKYDARGNSQRMTTNTIPYVSTTNSFKWSDSLINSIRSGGIYRVSAQSKNGSDIFYLPSTCNYTHTTGNNGDCAKLYRKIDMSSQVSCGGSSGRMGIGCRAGIITNHSDNSHIICYSSTAGGGRCANNGENIKISISVR